MLTCEWETHPEHGRCHLMGQVPKMKKKREIVSGTPAPIPLLPAVMQCDQLPHTTSTSLNCELGQARSLLLNHSHGKVTSIAGVDKIGQRYVT